MIIVSSELWLDFTMIIVNTTHCITNSSQAWCNWCSMADFSSACTGSSPVACLVYGQMAEWLNAADCKSAPARVRRFESYSSQILINITCIWALSLFGRAPRLHRGGEEFESPRVHFYVYPCVPIAQRIEQQPSKLEVDGSNPSGNNLCPYRLAVQDATLSRWRSRVQIPLGIDLHYLIIYFTLLYMAIPSQSTTSDSRPWWRKEFKIFTNEQIRANTIMIINEEWENLGTFSRDRALAMANDNWLDLIQLNYNPQTMVSTCTIQDYGKYQYQKKKSQNEKNKTKAKWMKELKIWYTISDHDLQLKMDKAIELIQDLYTVRFVIKLNGREMIFKSKALERMKFIVDWLWDQTRSQWIKEEPRWYSVVLAPKWWR